MTAPARTLFDIARHQLSIFMLRKADSLSRSTGFGYIDSDDAPNEYNDLLKAWKHCRATGAPFPVWNGASDCTVYTSSGANFAFRFWHDVLHCVHALAFTTADEITLGKMQVAAVAEHFGADSLEARIMYADTVAQSMHAAANAGEFPADQLEFVRAHVFATLDK